MIAVMQQMIDCFLSGKVVVLMQDEKGRLKVMGSKFGSNLSTVRKRAGISQETLAEQLCVSRQAVSNWERNLCEPDVSTINRIAELLNVPVTDLMESPAGGVTAVPKIRLVLTAICAALAAVHLTLGILGLVNVFAVAAQPVACAFIQSVIYIAFTMMNKSGNYDMLAGFDPKKDSIYATQLQMYWAASLSGLTTLIFEIIFVLVYFVPAEKQMLCTTVMIFSYYAAEVICFIAVSIKIKTRK